MAVGNMCAQEQAVTGDCMHCEPEPVRVTVT